MALKCDVQQSSFYPLPLHRGVNTQRVQHEPRGRKLHAQSDAGNWDRSCRGSGLYWATNVQAGWRGTICGLATGWLWTRGSNPRSLGLNLSLAVKRTPTKGVKSRTIVQLLTDQLNFSSLKRTSQWLTRNRIFQFSALTSPIQTLPSWNGAQ